MSESDADKGIRWEQRISIELEQTSCGLFCLTPENLDSRWLNFEAGAIAKTVEKAYVCTYLYELKPTDIKGPLSSFNHTTAEKDDSKKLIHTLNRALESQGLNENIVNDSFETYWSRLEEVLAALPPATQKTNPRNLDDMVEEILVSVRELLKERSLKTRQADELLSAYIPFLLQIAQRDPTFKGAPELLRSLENLATHPPRGTRPSRFNLPSTKAWDVREANELYAKAWRVAQTRLADLKSSDNVSERRVEELEEFANNVASNEEYAREVFRNLEADPSYYDYLLKAPLTQLETNL